MTERGSRTLILALATALLVAGCFSASNGRPPEHSYRVEGIYLIFTLDGYREKEPPILTVIAADGRDYSRAIGLERTASGYEAYLRMTSTPLVEAMDYVWTFPSGQEMIGEALYTHPAFDREWRVTELPDLVIYHVTDLSEYALQQFEEAFEYLTEWSGLSRREGKISVYLLPGYHSFAETISRMGLPQSDEVHGLTVGTRIFMPDSLANRPRLSLFVHELTHALTGQNGTPAVVEGFATYAETMEQVRGLRLHSNQLSLWWSADLIALERFLNDQDEQDRRLRIYSVPLDTAEAYNAYTVGYALMLLAREELGDAGVQRLAGRIGEGGVRPLEEVFGRHLQQLEQDLTEFVASGRAVDAHVALIQK